MGPLAESLQKSEFSRGRKLLVIPVVWISFVVFLGIWWTRLALDLAKKADALEHASPGVGLVQGRESIGVHYAHVSAILRWELPFFLLLLFLLSAVVVSIYLRELRRTKALQVFFASMSHELKTPLSSIRLQAESICDELAHMEVCSHSKPALEKSLRYTNLLMEDCQRLELQIERSLELARVQSAAKLFVEPVEICAWLEQSSKETSFGEFVSLVSHLPHVPGGLKVQADRGALRIIFRNLFENAQKHVAREIHAQSPLCVEVSARETAQGVEVLIQDNGGVGMKSSSMEGQVRGMNDALRYGELFEKGEASDGSGVGLYLVRTLMEKMGGEARFSRVHDGFCVTLVFVPAASLEMQASRNSNEAGVQ